MSANNSESSNAGSYTNKHSFNINDYMNPGHDQIESFNIPDTSYINTDAIKEALHNHNASKYSCLHLNIQSLPSKFDRLKELLKELNNANINIDFILLCETFLNDSNTQLYNLQGYNLISQNRSRLARGGVAIYVKSEYNYKLRNDLSVNVEGEFESIFIETKSKRNNETLIVGEIYRIPNTNINDSLQRYELTVNKLLHCKNIILGTDQNLDYLKLDSHKGTETLLETFLTGGIVPLINKPTRITHSTATLIDNIYTKLHPGLKITSGILCYDISDHLPLITLIGNTMTEKPKPLTFTHRPLCDEQVNKISSELKSVNWDFLQLSDTETSYNGFLEKLTNVIDKHAPVKTKTIPACKIIRDPWYSKGLLKSTKHLHRLYRKTIDKPNNDEIKHKYTEYRNLLNKLKRAAKNDYYKALFDRYRHNIKKTWQTINKVLNKANDKFTITDFFTSEPHNVAEEFCDYFTEIGVKCASNIPAGKHTAQSYLKGNHQNSLYLTPTDTNEIISVISSLKTSSTSGHDSFSSIIVKKLNDVLAIPLCILINKSIINGIVPSSLKVAKVIPIHKAGDKGELGNYRPISILPTFSKVYEKIFHKRLYAYLVSNAILYKSQYGF
jgi:hypothetical protein